MHRSTPLLFCYIQVGKLSDAINSITDLIENIKQLHNDILTSVQNQSTYPHSSLAVLQDAVRSLAALQDTV